MSVNQVVREGTPDTHAGKGTTPTMGGLIILAATFVPVVLWGRFNTRGGEYLLIAALVMAWMGGIGFLDDYLKLRQKREGLKNEGLVERYKLVGPGDGRRRARPVPLALAAVDAAGRVDHAAVLQVHARSCRPARRSPGCTCRS